ncbi:GNAT family N-acetyltransferase [Clostridium sp. 'deep sea']|uniref:GNAT family N-acetyltransferase n=1 Tax=Clostridium sp. 'deep sea' TaxID=2779445 RepID=UPI0018967927|nr:GNAT family N-acetyltransferase [Clostridium sp. 'deep sea']QOR34390.1 GNAT family N-acetyltransferase [Clostridium sp. 'deep sea']
MNLTHIGTQEIETDRLILRKFTISDTELVFHNWSKDEDVCKYLSWNPHFSINHTKNIISNWLECYQKLNCYNWVISLKKSKELIGTILITDIWESTRCVEIAYCIGKKYWNKGYATEALKAVSHFMFIDVNVNRIQAKHDIENIASGCVLNKAEMVHEGILRKNIIINGQLRDCCIYSLLKQDLFKAPANIYYDNMKNIKGNNIELVCKRMLHAVPEKDYVTNYLYDIRILNGRDSIGKLNFKVGFNHKVYYSGHIGYQIYQAFRGKSYSAEACKLIKKIAKQLGFNKLLITNNPNNIASRKICDKIGAVLIRVAKLPPNHQLYKVGERYTCIYQWQL